MHKHTVATRPQAGNGSLLVAADQGQARVTPEPARRRARARSTAALPRIIHTLRGRGYTFVTVTKLLHDRMIWGPAR